MIDVQIVKNDGQIENYNASKLRKSIIQACLSVHAPDGEAETTALNVVKAVEQWLGTKDEVTSADIRRKANDHLVAYNAEAAYMYKQKRAIA